MTTCEDCLYYPVCDIPRTAEDCGHFEKAIIRCKDCKWWHREIHNGVEYFNFNSCDLNHCGDGNSFYCADAERKE